MTREIERSGIPVAHVCTMVNVAMAMGSKRVVGSRSVLYPTGDPELTPDGEFRLRQRIIEVALKAIRSRVDVPTLFEVPL